MLFLAACSITHRLTDRHWAAGALKLTSKREQMSDAESVQCTWFRVELQRARIIIGTMAVEQQQPSAVAEFVEDTDLSLVKHIHKSWSERSCFSSHSIIWFTTTFVCISMAVVNIHSLCVQIYTQATSTNIDVVENDLFQFPNVTVCFEGLAELVRPTDALMWSPYANADADGPSWPHTITPYVREEMAMLARMPQTRIVDQKWTYITFVYIEAYFRVEYWLLTTAGERGRQTTRWVGDFGRLLNATFAPFGITADDLRAKYTSELLRYVNCTGLASFAHVQPLFINDSARCIFVDYDALIDTAATGEFELLHCEPWRLQDKSNAYTVHEIGEPPADTDDYGMTTLLYDALDTLRFYASFNPQL